MPGNSKIVHCGILKKMPLVKHATVFQNTREGTSFIVTSLPKQIFACQLQLINEQYESQLEQIMKAAKVSGEVNVTGDGRCDFPGHSALFGLFSLMDGKTRKILTAHVLKVREEASVFVVVFMKHTMLKKLNSHFNDLLFVWIIVFPR